MKQIIFSAVAAFLLSFATTLISCVKNLECEPVVMQYKECTIFFDNFVRDGSASIIGKWKLETRLAGRGQCSDHSQCNIVYEFKANGDLVISGQRRSPIGHRIGSHSFSTAATDICGLYFLHVNSSTDPPYGLELSRDRMVVSRRVFTGMNNYIFIRISEINFN